MASRIHSYVHDGLEFDVLDQGPLHGTPVLLLHGFPERASHWNDVAAVLHTRGYRTLAPDQRGYSPGARPRARHAYRMSKLVGDARALAEAVGTPVHLVGHDWGAAVAWQLAADHRERVLSLTAVSVPHPRAFAEALLTSSQAFRSWYVLAFQPPLATEAAARLVPGAVDHVMRRFGLGEADLERFRAEIVDYGALPGALGWYRAIPWNLGSPTPAVRVPTTHVWSDRDPALARRGAELTARHVAAPYEFRELHGVSHWVPLQAPQQLAALILQRVQGSREP